LQDDGPWDIAPWVRAVGIGTVILGVLWLLGAQL